MLSSLFPLLLFLQIGLLFTDFEVKNSNWLLNTNLEWRDSSKNLIVNAELESAPRLCDSLDLG